MSQLISSFAIMLYLYVAMTVVFCVWAQTAGNTEKGQQQVKAVGGALIALFVISAIGLNFAFATHGMSLHETAKTQIQQRVEPSEKNKENGRLITYILFPCEDEEEIADALGYAVDEESMMSEKKS